MDDTNSALSAEENDGSSGQDVLKAGTNTIEVNDFTGLQNAINSAVQDSENDTYIINLNPGTYEVASNTNLEAGTYTPNIIINGNHQQLVGKSAARQLQFKTGCNITINDCTITVRLFNYNNMIVNNSMCKVRLGILVIMVILPYMVPQ